MKKIRLELVAPVSRASFIEIYDGDDFRKFVLENHPHIHSVEILERRDDELIRFVRSRTTLKVELPGFLSVIKHLVKPINEEEQTFFKKEYRAEFRSQSSISRSHAHITYVEESPTKTRRVVDLELEATRVPGPLKRRAEEFFAQKAHEQIMIYEQVINRFLEQKKAS